MNDIKIPKIDLHDALGLVDKAVSIDSDIQIEEKLKLETTGVLIQLKEREEIIKMRQRWSTWILVCIVSIVVFDFLIIGFLGFGLITFPEGYLVPAFIADSLVKTLGLAVIVVQFLFNEKSLK